MLARIILIFSVCHLTTTGLLGNTIFLTTDATENLNGLTIRDGDIAQFNTTTGNASLFFNEDVFAANESVDAFQVLSGTSLLLSTASASNLGGVAFAPGDIIQYDMNTGVATEFFDSSLFTAGENIDAFHVLADGTILLSTVTVAELGGLTFEDGDVVRYDPGTDTASLFFDGSLFAADEDVDGVHLSRNGFLLLSTQSNASIGGLAFNMDDIIEYNMVADTATVFVSETVFSGPANINGVAVPTPSLNPLWMCALLAIFRVQPRARHRS